MEAEFKVKIKISDTKRMYDEDGIPIQPERLEKMLVSKFKEIIKEYTEGGGVEIDFLNSEFGVEEAEGLEYYGNIDIKVE